MVHRLFNVAMLLVSLFCMIVFFSCSKDSPTDPGTSFTVTGKVVDASGDGIAEVAVSLSGETRFTDSSGKYRFDDIENGVHSIEFTKDGYIFPSTMHAIVNGKNVTIDDITESDIEGLTLVSIPAGSFQMGDQSGEGRSVERPVHEVSLSAFQMSAYEITQEQHEAVMGENPSEFTGENLPVDNVSWFNAITFCNALSIQAGLKPCYDEISLVCDFGADGFRLPTEAEWEYACRAGTETNYYTGDTEESLMTAAWYHANGDSVTHTVGTKEPNAWGLYDMHGNVEEMCNDLFDSDYYESSPTNDPTGSETGNSHIIRGGSFYYVYQIYDANGNYNIITSDCRSANRATCKTYSKLSYIGFRVVRRP